MFYIKLFIILTFVTFSYGEDETTFIGQRAPMLYEFDYDKVFFTTTSCGYGILKIDKDYCSVSISKKYSRNVFLGLELILLKYRYNGSIYHKDSSFIGKNTSFSGYMTAGLRFKPKYDIAISPYIGIGSTIDYTKIVSIATISSGIDISYMLWQYVSLSMGYKNISYIFLPTININHFATINMQISLITR